MDLKPVKSGPSWSSRISHIGFLALEFCLESPRPSFFCNRLRFPSGLVVFTPVTMAVRSLAFVCSFFNLLHNGGKYFVRTTHYFESFCFLFLCLAHRFDTFLALSF